MLGGRRRFDGEEVLIDEPLSAGVPSRKVVYRVLSSP